MSIQIESDHLMNLADGQLLYNDLRNRINVATVAETMEIITEYGKQEDDDEMIIETEWYDEGTYKKGFRTIISAEEIIGYYTSGKSLIFHLPATEESSHYSVPVDDYITLIEYHDGYEQNYTYPPYFGFSYGSGNGSFVSYFTAPVIEEDGKLYLGIYID